MAYAVRERRKLNDRDLAIICERQENGEILRLLAKEYNISKPWLEDMVRDFKERYYGIKDIGKAHALRNAGWSIRDIALEMHRSEDAVREALAKEPPISTYWEDERRNEGY